LDRPEEVLTQTRSLS